MKFKVLLVLFLVAVAWVAGRHLHVNKSDTFKGDGREEIHKNFQLEPGAQVEVRGINGPVEIQTTEGGNAELHIWRTAENKSDLENSAILIEQTPTSLTVRAKQRSDWWKFWTGGNVRQQLKLVLPRSVELATHGINGPLNIGGVDGSLNITGVNGRVEVAQTAGHTEITGINGHVNVGIARLNDEGFGVKGVNGGVELRVPAGINAELDVKGLNGGVSCDLPNLSEQERTRSGMHARIGTGGPQISINGINGGVKIASASTSEVH